MLSCALQCGLVQEWEQKLSKYGLSHAQLRRECQSLTVPEVETVAFQTYAHDKELTRHWKFALVRQSKIEGNEVFKGGFQRIRCRYYEVPVPAWTRDDTKCRMVLHAMYPALLRTYDAKARHSYGSRVFFEKCRAGVRKRAARTWFIIYCTYRLGMPAEAIGEQLGIKGQRVWCQLKKACACADKLFKN